MRTGKTVFKTTNSLVLTETMADGNCDCTGVLFTQTHLLFDGFFGHAALYSHPATLDLALSDLELFRPTAETKAFNRGISQ